MTDVSNHVVNNASLYLVVITTSLTIIVLFARVLQGIRRVSDEQKRMLVSMARRRDELEAALASMVEGVLAVDLDGRLISLNQAMSRILPLSASRSIGRKYGEIIRSPPLVSFITSSLKSDQPIQADIELPIDNRQCTFLAQGSVFRHGDGIRIGSLIVLHDITRLRRLEVIRRDFVSNASHEIRTPVAAIKMAAETLDEEVESMDTKTVQRFINIIARQSNRLSALIDDLLSLARIERDSEQGNVTLTRVHLREILQSAIETCQTAVTPHGKSISMDCETDFVIALNPPLLERAVVNLLDNAIKYSEKGSQVRCRVDQREGELVISVIDEGVGIAPEHLPRIFERFYRTDKARSRDLGGTGLGLAIVKHVAQTHGGDVSVESNVGRGSTFRIHLPYSTHGTNSNHSDAPLTNA